MAAGGGEEALHLPRGAARDRERPLRWREQSQSRHGEGEQKVFQTKDLFPSFNVLLRVCSIFCHQQA